MPGDSTVQSERRGFWHHLLGEVQTDSDMRDQVPTYSAAERRSLDFVQRVVVSLLVVVAMGTVSAALSLYLIVGHTVMPRSDVIGLWIMTGIVGLLCVATTLMINRRRPYHPLLVLGLTPMVTSWFWVFG